MNGWQKYIKKKTSEFEDTILNLCCEAVVLLKSGKISQSEFDGTMDDLLISHEFRKVLMSAYENAKP